MQKPRLIDLTRSLRRAGRVSTGVDRVELAYLRRLLAEGAPVFALIRTAFGYVILDRIGVQTFCHRLSGDEPWGKSDMLSRLPRQQRQTVRQAESDVRRLSCVRATRLGLHRALTRQFPAGFSYYNVGHSNLTNVVLNAVKRAQGETHVMVHDVIPLEHPQYQRPGTVDSFRNRLQRVSAKADRIIYNSRDTRDRAEVWLREWGRVPPAVVAHLGTDVAVPDPTSLPPRLPPNVPYFVTVGTIEPRKNHAMLLDIWEGFGATAPPLLICGNRGWNNDAVFARLDALSTSNCVQEIADLSDPALASLVAGAAGLLFPTHAEGYGLPPLEALALGARVLCNDLSVLRETMGDNAVYASVTDRYSWEKTIRQWAEKPSQSQKTSRFFAPTWDEHFKAVLNWT